MTVFENVIVGGLGAHGAQRESLEVRAQALLAQVGLAAKAQMPVESLSYGAQRRRAIARALGT